MDSILISIYGCVWVNNIEITELQKPHVFFIEILMERLQISLNNMS